MVAQEIAIKVESLVNLDATAMTAIVKNLIRIQMLTDKVISSKDLIKAVAKASDYNMYEVEDILRALNNVMMQNFKEGRSVKFEYFFEASPKYVPPRRYLNPTTGNEEISSGRMSLSIRILPWLQKELNDNLPNYLAKHPNS